MARRLLLISLLLLVWTGAARADLKKDAGLALLGYGRKLGNELFLHISAAAVVKWLEEHIWSPDSDHRQRPEDPQIQDVLRKMCVDNVFLLQLDPEVAAGLRCQPDCQACIRFFDQPDRSIAGCTVVIQSQRERGASLAAAFMDRGLAYYFKSQFDSAIRDYNIAIEINPVEAAAFYNRGIAYAEKHDYAPAMRDFDNAIALSSNDPERRKWAFYNRGEAYMRQEKWDLAIPDLDRAIDLDPTFGNALAERGDAYNMKGDYARAIGDLSRPSLPDAGQRGGDAHVGYVTRNLYRTFYGDTVTNIAKWLDSRS